MLQNYNFQENDHNKPWYQQSSPTAIPENEQTKIIWDVSFHLEEQPENGANKITMAVLDRVKLLDSP